MSYDKYTWQNGEVITAEKLNHIEEGIEANQPGYECTESRTLLTEESVTTEVQYGTNVASLSYPTLLTQDELTVTFDGVEYVCDKMNVGPGIAYGGVSASGPDFTEYPFALLSYTSGDTVHNDVYTETAGTHSLKVEESTRTVTTTPCFKKAVGSLLPSSTPVITLTATSNTEGTISHTGQQIYDMIRSGDSPIFVWRIAYGSKSGSYSTAILSAVPEYNLGGLEAFIIKLVTFADFVNNELQLSQISILPSGKQFSYSVTKKIALVSP